MKKTVKAAFTASVPVMLGYVFVGIAFGLLMRNAGYSAWWAALMSVLVYAGSMQFVAINFFSGAFSLTQIILMTLAVNIRHVFYGLSMIDRFKGMGARKPYMIFSLTDETYSLLCSAKTPEGANPKTFMFLIALFNQLYWITGSAVGALAGEIIPFNTKGIDFAMTALFIVICTEQWLTYPSRIPAIIGVCAAVGSLIVFGKDSFILPAMIISVLFLMLLRSPITKASSKATEAAAKDCETKGIVVEPAGTVSEGPAEAGKVKEEVVK
ncbi:AzlC family ABC transporter permease [Acetanaerobacterium elongatum]|uniref:4-azaleucine resistance probable transporter AzlC n=1 Tax=Acetanaerobacterium elongatum TaxID=258515 RepID=A0A1H0BPQ7_9FIRM|nr:AzlC family ABC transporter permease [Acetanaerobacterium elongatum]SDN47568.1 4-azaleucine resistance probable transporter AzlC [Acetanaerobacterium elongatum]